MKTLLKLKRLIGLIGCRLGFHDVIFEGDWSLRCARCGRTGHHYDQEHWYK